MLKKHTTSRFPFRWWSHSGCPNPLSPTYGPAHRDCSTFLHFGYSQSPMGAHGGPIRVRDGQKRGFWAAPPGCGMARNGVSGRRAPGCQMARNPENSRGFWPSRTREPRFSGEELVEAKFIVSYFLRLCYIFLRFSMFLATGPGHLISAFSIIPKA